MPNVTILNRCEGQITREYEIFNIPGIGNFSGIEAYPVESGFTATVTVNDVGYCKFQHWDDGDTSRTKTLAAGSEDIVLYAITSDAAVNKVVIGETILLDLSEDSLDSTDELKYGETAHSRDGKVLTGTGRMVDQTQTVTQDKVPTDTTYTDTNGIKLNGTAEVIPFELKGITRKNESVYIGGGTQHTDPAYLPSGYVVNIAQSEQAKIISDNIPYGTSILGVDGNVYERAIGGGLSDGTVQYYYLKPGTTKLQVAMFQACLDLKQIYNTESIQEVYQACFYATMNLNSLSLPNLTKIGNEGYSLSGDNAFYGCGSTLLKNISLPLLATIYGQYVFGGCNNLQTLSLPSLNITSTSSRYGVGLCHGDGALQSVDISNSTVIPKNAFYGCSSLTNIQVKNGAYYSTSYYKCKVATINDITYMIQESNSNEYIYRASDPSTVVATLTSSSPTATVDNVTFKYITSGTYTYCVQITW